ncbi:hypothetical protein OIU85_021322 [Salix viminalis]|uniref:Amino acid transporter transmembrane domain-containing protein n=1 Tax=Salix viminalis TaxID=40686 RepID=A0A9Q0ZDH6_SALVM|nr:hypothetical protein OIU85_021322 [Salix viminalis]
MGENTSAKNQVFSVSIDANPPSGSKWSDDDGRPKRTGQPWWSKGQDMRICSVSKPFWCCHWLHNCIFDKHDPLFAFVEKEAARRFPDSDFVTKDIKIFIPGLGPCNFNLFRMIWRTIFVVTTTVISMLLPFFNDVVGLLGALGFWPLTVYFPVEMYISQKKIPKWSTRWLCLQILSVACLIITIAAAAGSIAGVIDDVKTIKPFQTSY